MSFNEVNFLRQVYKILQKNALKTMPQDMSIGNFCQE